VSPAFEKVMWDLNVVSTSQSPMAKVAGGAQDIFAAAAARLTGIAAQSKTVEEEWQSIVDEVDKASLAMVRALETSLPEKGTVFPEKKDTDSIRAGMEEMQGQIRLASLEYQTLQYTLMGGAKQFEFTEKEKTEMLEEALGKQTNMQ